MIEKKEFPILEFDTNPVAKINPEQLTGGEKWTADKLIITFFPEALKKLLEENQIEKCYYIGGENPISNKDVTKLKLYYSNLFDQNKTNNNWWIARINNTFVHHTEVAESVKKNKKIIMDSITAENIQKFLTDYFDEENYIAVILSPEK